MQKRYDLIVCGEAIYILFYIIKSFNSLLVLNNSRIQNYKSTMV